MSSTNRLNNEFPIGRIARIVVGIILVIAVIILPFKICEWQDNGEIMVIQSPVSGKMTWSTTGGLKWQWFGKVTKYQKRSQFWFSNKEDQNKGVDQSIKIRFNDGGHGNVSGSMSWDMPMDESHLTELHVKYGSQEAVDKQLVRTVIEKSVYMTGPLMSSTESYASRRSELLQYIDDQMNRGVYKTEAVDTKIKDAMTGIEKTVKVVSLIKGSNGDFAREDQSPFQTFGIQTYNLSLNEIKYDSEVENQIKNQQQAIMSVQQAIADAKKAEQNAITISKQGEAEAATAKWKQEVIKAQMVTEAEQRKEVAKLDLESAKLKKEADIALGEGEARRRELVMNADGALEKKLATYTEVNRLYAEAIKEYRGQWVPTVVMGSHGTADGGTGTGGAQELIQLLTTKTAMDLALDMKIEAKTPEQSVSDSNKQTAKNN